MKIAWIATSGRDVLKRWDETDQYGLGTTVVAMIEGFRAFPEHEIHIVMAVRRNCLPERREGNIIYHEVKVPMWGMMKTLYAGSTRSLLRKLIQIKPDIVHGQGTERECALPAIFSGLPNVLTIHGNMAELARLNHARIGSFGWLAARLENFVLPRTEGVFCNSEYTYQLVAPRAARTWKVPNPILSEYFTKIDASHKYRHPTLLNVGVVSARKRQVELLRFAKALHLRHPSLRWVFVGPVGSDPYSHEFMELVSSPEYTSFVQYRGRLETHDVRLEMDRCHGMVHFPVEESFGLVAAEAIARELKVFASDVGGLRDVCAGTPQVSLVDVDDWNGLSAQINSWINEGCYGMPGGFDLIRSKYHPKVISDLHFRIYRELISEKFCS
jgi:glycosyltransferase involved in cell wall biosynthesis